MIHVNKSLWRGPRPKSLKELRLEGFDTIINLESGIYEAFHNDQYEREFASDYGLKFYNLTLNDFLPPNKSDVLKALEVISRDEKTYVHCLAGVDRTGFVVAVYRMQAQGWSFAEAYKEWVRRGRHWWYDFWKHSLKKWEV